MFGRELKTKLSELRPNKSTLDEGIRDRDWNQKLSGKVSADTLPGDSLPDTLPDTDNG